jgi:hypothetical protein
MEALQRLVTGASLLLRKLPAAASTGLFGGLTLVKLAPRG